MAVNAPLFEIKLLVLLLFLGPACAQVTNYFTAPVGGDTITAGQPYTIKWSAETPGPVFIQLSYDDNLIAGNVTSSTSNSGSFVWTPDNVLAGFNRGENYFLVICDILLGGCGYTPDGRFAINTANAATSSLSSSETSSSTSSNTGSTSAPTTSIAPTSLSPSTVTATATVTSTNTPISTPNSSTGGLSAGAKVAIGVVIPVVAIAALGLALYLLRRRRRLRGMRKELKPSYTDVKNCVHNPAELPGEGARAELYSGKHKVIQAHELGS